MWQQLAPEVARLGLIHGEGAGLLVEYCRLSVEWHEILVNVRGEEAVIETPRGLRRNPRWRDHLRIERRLLRLGDQLGMSPLVRARMGLR